MCYDNITANTNLATGNCEGIVVFKSSSIQVNIMSMLNALPPAHKLKMCETTARALRLQFYPKIGKVLLRLTDKTFLSTSNFL